MADDRLDPDTAAGTAVADGVEALQAYLFEPGRLDMTPPVFTFQDREGFFGSDEPAGTRADAVAADLVGGSRARVRAGVTSMMSCDEVRKAMHLYLDGELPEREALLARSNAIIPLDLEDLPALLPRRPA